MAPGFPLLIAIVFLASPLVSLNDPKSDDGRERALAVIQEAISARGGDAYLQVRTMVSNGQYTPFQKGVSGLPIQFVDYLEYPDGERTEFGRGNRKYIQTNRGDEGWIYDAPQKMIRDQTEEQIRLFQQGARFDLDNLLRTGWTQEGVKLTYIERVEIWRNTFSDAVRMLFSDGAAATIYFDLRTRLPLATEYRAISEEGTSNDQVRYHRWVDFGSVKFPTIHDSYREGQQRARVAYETVNFNVPIAEKLFEKPANIKDVK